MTLRKLIVVALLILVGIGALFFVTDYIPRPSPNPDPLVAIAPMQRKIGFQSESALKAKGISGEQIRRGILIRSQSSRELLVRFVDTLETYKYESEKKEISPATDEEWLSAKDEISCKDKIGDSDFLVIDPKEGRATFREPQQQIVTFGKHALYEADSPRKDLAVVLSAEGPKTTFLPGIWGFSSRGGQTLGRRFVEILDLNNRRFVTPPLALSNIHEVPSYRFCWSNDEKFVIAYEIEDIYTLPVEMDFHIIETEY